MLQNKLLQLSVLAIFFSLFSQYGHSFHNSTRGGYLCKVYYYAGNTSFRQDVHHRTIFARDHVEAEAKCAAYAQRSPRAYGYQVNRPDELSRSGLLSLKPRIDYDRGRSDRVYNSRHRFYDRCGPSHGRAGYRCEIYDRRDYSYSDIVATYYTSRTNKQAAIRFCEAKLRHELPHRQGQRNWELFWEDSLPHNDDC